MPDNRTNAINMQHAGEFYYNNCGNTKATHAAYAGALFYLLLLLGYTEKEANEESGYDTTLYRLYVPED